MASSSSSDPFASPRRAALVTQIKERFGDLLGSQVALLEQEDGLEELLFRLECGEFGPLP